MLARQEYKGHWAALKRAFRLLVDDVDDQSPSDPAYVFSGHCPLTVRPVVTPCDTFLSIHAHGELVCWLHSLHVLLAAAVRAFSTTLRTLMMLLSPAKACLGVT